MTGEHGIKDLLRDLAPRVLGTLVRRHGQFDACEDAVHTHRLEAVRGHLLERAGEPAAARAAYLKAAQMTASEPEQRYLAQRAARLGSTVEYDVD